MEVAAAKSESEVVRPRGLRLSWTVAAVGLLVVSLLVGIAAGPVDLGIGEILLRSASGSTSRASRPR